MGQPPTPMITQRMMPKGNIRPPNKDSEDDKSGSVIIKPCR